MASFKLFVIGDSGLGQVAEMQFRLVIAPELPDCDLEVVDIVQQPDMARRYNVLATPLLVRVDAHPPVRLIGDLSNTTSVRQALQLPARNDDRPELDWRER